jgi:hypothetical protein
MPTKRRSPENPDNPKDPTLEYAVSKLCRLGDLPDVTPEQSPLARSMEKLKKCIGIAVSTLSNIASCAVKIEQEYQKAEQVRKLAEEQARKESEQARKLAEEQARKMVEESKLVYLEAMRLKRQKNERDRQYAKAEKERLKSQAAIEYSKRLPTTSGRNSYAEVYGRRPRKARYTESGQFVLVTKSLIDYLKKGTPVESAQTNKVRNALYTIMRRFENTAVASLVCIASSNHYHITWDDVPNVKEKFLNMC